jgi:hypothetical protein
MLLKITWRRAALEIKSRLAKSYSNKTQPTAFVLRIMSSITAELLEFYYPRSWHFISRTRKFSSSNTPKLANWHEPVPPVSHLVPGLPIGCFPTGFPPKCLCIPCLSTLAACLEDRSLLCFTTVATNNTRSPIQPINHSVPRKVGSNILNG